MSGRQIILNPVLHKAIPVMSIVWSCIALNFVYAEGQSYIYASDIIKGKSNDNKIEKQKNQPYNYEKPLTFQNKLKPYQPGYSYPPASQKHGSNPFTNQQHQYQFLPDNNIIDSSPYERKKHYRYPPPIQKFGSNPFIKQSN